MITKTYTPLNISDKQRANLKTLADYLEQMRGETPLEYVS